MNGGRKSAACARWSRLWAVCALLLAGPLAAQTCPANLPDAVAPDARFVVSEPDPSGFPGDQVVSDTRTGLMWKRCPEGLSGATCGTGTVAILNWSAALTAAENATHAGFSDWRLPSIHELQSLVETRCHSPSINVVQFPANGNFPYASSTAYVPDGISFWRVDFRTGALLGAGASRAGTGSAVRWVRSGQGLAAFAAEGDAEPDAFSLIAQAAVPLSSERTSSAITVQGLTTVSGIGVSGAGGSSYSINGGAFTGQPGAVANGDTVQVRHLSASTAATQTLTTLSIGGVSADFVSTTADVPGAPTIGVATAGDGSASVAFTVPGSDGGSAITGFTASSDPEGLTSVGCTASPCTVTGLSNGTAYTFTVTATNAVGTGSASAASNSVTPQAPQTIVFAPLGDRLLGEAAFTVSATGGGSGNPVTFASLTPAVCTGSGSDGSLITLAATGTCTLEASQAGSASFTAAPAVSQSFGVSALIEISRLLPAGPRLMPPMGGGSTVASYAVTVRNGGSIALPGVSLDVRANAGLNNVLWDCNAPGTCQPATGAGETTTQFSLDPGQSARVELIGAVDFDVRFVEIRAVAQLPDGVLALRDGAKRAVLIEPANVDALYRNGFE